MKHRYDSDYERARDYPEPSFPVTIPVHDGLPLELLRVDTLSQRKRSLLISRSHYHGLRMGDDSRFTVGAARRQWARRRWDSGGGRDKSPTRPIRRRGGS